MVNTRFVTGGEIGAVIDKAASSTLSDFGGFALGTRVMTSKGKEAILVKAGTAIAPDGNAIISSVFTATGTTTGTWENKTGSTAATNKYLWLVQESVQAN